MKRCRKALQAGLILFAFAAADVGQASESAVGLGAMTGAYFMRDTLVPRAEDLALLRRKSTLYLSSFNDDMATVAYSMENGRIVYRIVSGTIDAAARDKIDRALAKFRRKLA